MTTVANILEGRERRWLIVVLIVGLAIRIALVLISYGSRDALYWSRFASDVQTHGFYDVWRIRHEMNHPPIPVAYAAAAWEVVGGTVRDQWRFCLLLKLPGIIADVATAILLWRIGRRRLRERAGVVMAAVFFLSPLAMLISGYHGNTDPVLAFFCLLAFSALDRGRPGWASVALGAAINIKLSPLILVLPAMAMCRSPREAARFVSALSLGALPFIPLLLHAGRAFFSNAVGYELFEARWGLMYPALLIECHDHQNLAKHGLVDAYMRIGKGLVWASTIALALWQWRRRTFDAFEVGALAFALLLIFAPGFGLQYLLWPLPLLTVVRPKFGAVYGAVSGAFAAAAYVYFLMPGKWPLVSNFTDLMPHGVAIVGVVVWAMLLGFVIAQSRKRYQGASS